MVKFISWSLLFAILLTGCSDSNKPTSDTPFSDDPFSTPDPNGSSFVEQLGYREIRDISRYLATAQYLDLYFDIDPLMGDLIREAGAVGPGKPYNCPEGGSLSVTAISNDESLSVINAAFTDCKLSDRNVTGTATRSYTELYPSAGFEQVDCEYEGNDVAYSAVFDIASASIKQVNIAGKIEISDSKYDRRSGSFYDVTSDKPSCPTSQLLIENADTKANFLNYGSTEINGSAIIATNVNIDEDTESRVGIQSTRLSDDSSVVISALADEADRVQVDVSSNGATLSFEDDYRFEAPDFIVEY